MAEPASYNAAIDLLSSNIKRGRGDKTAYVDAAGHHSFAKLDQLSNRAANALRRAGLQPGDRITLCMFDSFELPVVFLGAIKAGIIPVPLNTLLTSRDYSYILNDCGARALFVSPPLLPQFADFLEADSNDVAVIVDGAHKDDCGHALLNDFIAAGGDAFEAVRTAAGDMCFWLYTSGTTGRPKGVVHVHSSLMSTARQYARPVLGIGDSDMIYSAAKFFFAYGLGNQLTFPLATGAAAVLLAGPPTPEAVCEIIREQKPTVFFGVPTLYAMLLASDLLPGPDEHNLRVCVSAGEALPAELLTRWKKRMGVEILDGIGSTEMLHIFLSNRSGQVKLNSTGKAVDGYEARLVDDDGQPVAVGELGSLEVAGPTSATMYWNQPERSSATFRGRWTRTGDQYHVDEEGFFIFGGRSDDMLKVGGIFVSPFEVESALVEHDAVMEAAVVGQADQDELIKPKAFVVLHSGVDSSAELADELKKFVKTRLAGYKYPRWIEFTDELPKTATGKIQRFKLRD